MSRIMGKKVEVVDVLPAEKPPLSEAIRYWIRFPVSNKKGAPRQGFVNDVNMQHKELTVVFEDSSNMKEEKVSYDYPGLLWFEETGVLVERDGIPKKMNLTNMYDIWLVAANKPPLLDAKHYWVRINNDPSLHLSSSPRSIERQYFYGYVVSIKENIKSIGVFFDELNKVVFVSYDTPASDLRWYHELLEQEAKAIIRKLDGTEEEEKPAM